MNKDSLANSITAHQLRAFTTVADTLSYAKAAEPLHYTQPGVYLQVKSLEALLGCKLFERAGRGLRLTPIGSALLPACYSALADLDRIEHIVRNAREMRRVTVAAGPTGGPYLLPALIREFAKEEPQIIVDIDLNSPAELIDRVASGAADLALGAQLNQRQIPEFLSLTHLFDEPYVLIQSAAAETAPRPAQIYAAGTPTRLLQNMSRELQAAGIFDCEIRGLPTAEAVKGACLTGRGYALLSGPAVAAELQAGVFRRVEGFSATLSFWSCHRVVEHLSDEARVFLEFLHRYAARLQDSRQRPWLEYEGTSPSPAVPSPRGI
jgi:DNA-binding transcriptional LysR family regulator